jgi:hypothetical protein
LGVAEAYLKHAAVSVLRHGFMRASLSATVVISLGACAES